MGAKMQSVRRLPALWLALTALWLLVWIATPISLWLHADSLFALMASLGVLAQSAASLAGAAQTWPVGRIMRVAIVVAAAAWLVEYLGQATGWPFGDYSYTALLQPQVGGVPLLIPLAWLMMLFPAWAVTEALLQVYRARLGRYYAPVFAALAGLVFTAWDLYLDPQMVARGLWVWHQPGAYFGIPLQNYFGWWLAAFAITWLVRPTNLAQPSLIAIYALTALFQFIGLGLFWGQSGPALFGLLGMGAALLGVWYTKGRMQ